LSNWYCRKSSSRQILAKIQVQADFGKNPVPVRFLAKIQFQADFGKNPIPGRFWHKFGQSFGGYREWQPGLKLNIENLRNIWLQYYGIQVEEYPIFNHQLCDKFKLWIWVYCASGNVFLLYVCQSSDHPPLNSSGACFKG